MVFASKIRIRFVFWILLFWRLGAGFVCFERESGGQMAGGGVFFPCLAANWIRRLAVVQAGPGKR